jgi:hypothetical protein
VTGGRAPSTTQSWKFLVLFASITTLLIAMTLVAPIPQNENYHHFADTRAFGSIPNCLNVLSSIFFLLVGLWGIQLVLGEQKSGFARPCLSNLRNDRPTSFSFWALR